MCRACARLCAYLTESRGKLNLKIIKKAESTQEGDAITQDLTAERFVALCLWKGEEAYRATGDISLTSLLPRGTTQWHCPVARPPAATLSFSQEQTEL